ncbi:MAG: LapA family protein [Deltaproteobacteria bacterium]|nr:LapA family protein [Deltaproteobacteria bacterium]
MKRFLTRPRTIFWGLISLLLLIIILQNVEPTPVDFLFWSLPATPKLLLILISMAAGSLLTLLLSWEIRRIRGKRGEGTPP